MKKIMKLTAIVMISMMLCMMTSVVFAAPVAGTDTTGGTGSSGMLQPGDITPTYDSAATSDLQGIAGSIMGLIRNIAVIAGVIILAVIGVKFMLGSPEEKSEYKKSLMPLVIGVIVVMAATQIMTMIFGFFD